MAYLRALFTFGIQQALSCLFPVAVFLTLAVSRLVPPILPRYDFIFLICVLVQWLMVRYKLESRDELKVISMFHVIGLILEIYKVHMGSWAYPEFAYLKIWGVPLYSGFMYASVASYICQAWKRLDLTFINWPRALVTYPLAILIYLNFFTHHYLPDIRWLIIISLFLLFGKTTVLFRVDRRQYRMQVILAFLLIGVFIWFAENIATFLGAWQYPDQAHAWRLVHTGKITSWFLLVIISIIIVANLKHLKYGSQGQPAKACARQETGRS